MREAIVVVGLDHRILSWSPGATRVYGWSEGEALGRPVCELIRPDVSPPDYDASLKRLFAEGGGTETSARRRKDGAVLMVEATFVVVPEEGGSPGRVLVVSRDVTARLRSEEERRLLLGRLQESEARFRAMADGAPVLIWVASSDKRCTWMNRGAREFTGCGLDEGQGTGWTRSLHPEDLQATLEARDAAFDAQVAFTLEFRVRRRDGAYRWIRDSGVPRYDDAGTFLGYIGSGVDVTDHRLAEDRMLEALRANEKLLGELREAMGRVKTLSGLLPICQHCHRIRDGAGAWVRMEEYISQRSQASFAHGLCPECLEKHYPG
jgi:PAS domain S-box-containing protein